MNKLEPKIIYTCILETKEELVECKGFRWTKHPLVCNWKALSGECLNKNINKHVGE